MTKTDYADSRRALNFTLRAGTSRGVQTAYFKSSLRSFTDCTDVADSSGLKAAGVPGKFIYCTHFSVKLTKRSARKTSPFASADWHKS